MERKRKYVCAAGVCALIVATSSATAAPILLTGNYSENFNSMGAPSNTTLVSTPNGWYVGASADTVGNGAVSGTSVETSDGNIAAGNGQIGNYNYGNSGQSGRSLGTCATTSKGHRVMEVRFVNNLGYAIQSFELLYDGKQWRRENNAGNQVLVAKYSVDGITFTNLGATFDFNSIDDGNNTGSGGINGDSVRLNNIGGIVTPSSPIPMNGTFYLRWFDFNDGGVADHGLAIDNVRVQNFTAVPEPTAIALLAIGAACIARRKR